MKYKYEMHCHTKMVSQCGKTEPKDIVEMYREKGYSGLVVTEHYSPLTFGLNSYYKPQRLVDFYISSYEELKKYETDDFSVFFGMELRHYATGADYLIYGVDPDWLRKQGNLLAKWEKSVYEMMHKEGYLVFQAHPFRPYILRCNPKYIDGIEVYNGKCDKKTNDKALHWAEKTGKLMVSGSDFHEKQQLARGGIITNRRIADNNDLVEILKLQDFELIKTYD
ncbi:MAG: PHP domain-containing protein [Ruminococcaceae bacterium]|nr:PHP domain-containing protein [Oscillospiraceae bacterium]